MGRIVLSGLGSAAIGFWCRFLRLAAITRSTGRARGSRDSRAYVTFDPTLHIETGETSVTISCCLPALVLDRVAVVWWVGHPWLGIVRLLPLIYLLRVSFASSLSLPYTTATRPRTARGFWTALWSTKIAWMPLFLVGSFVRETTCSLILNMFQIHCRASWFRSCTSTSVASRCLPTPSWWG